MIYVFIMLFFFNTNHLNDVCRYIRNLSSDLVEDRYRL